MAEQTEQEIRKSLEGKSLDEQLAALEQMTGAPTPAPAAPEGEEKSPPAKEEAAPESKSATGEETPEEEKKAEMPEWEKRVTEMEQALEANSKRLADNQAWFRKVASENARLKREIEARKLEERKPERLINDPELEEVMEYHARKKQVLDSGEKDVPNDMRELTPEEATFKAALYAAVPNAKELVNDPEFNTYINPIMEKLGGDYLAHPAEVIGAFTSFVTKKQVAEAEQKARETARKEFEDESKKTRQREEEIGAMSAPSGGKGRKPVAQDDELERLKKMSLDEISRELEMAARNA